MNIAIDVLAILGPDSKNRGIGNYTTSQLKKLFEIDKDNRYFLLNFIEDVSLKELLHYSDNVSEHYFYAGEGNILLKNREYKPIIGDVVKQFIKQNEIDVFYVTAPFDRHISYDADWLSGVKTVVTLYDIIPYVFKERYLSNKTGYTEYMSCIHNIERFDKILAISQSAKDDFIEHFKTVNDQIDVIYAGIDEWYTNLNMTDEDKKHIRKQYNIQDEFIMCTGGDDDRKNISELIKAYAKMPKHLIDKYQLVIACRLSQSSVERYHDIANKNNVRDRLILTNFVPLDHLIKLYNMAHVVAFPSQYEGFGLPVIEAMACSTAVLTSNNSSLGEIARDAAILVDPFDRKDITRGLVEILESADLNDLVAKGHERLNLFQWEKVARDTLHAFESIMKNEKEEVVESEKRKIAFFTPLPPKQSGIADYSLDILNELVNYFSIDVYIDKGYVVECKLNDGIDVYSHDKFAANRNKYADIVYQVGNSDYHSYMFPYIKKYSGTVVLHDYNLHGVIHYLTARKGDLKSYKELLCEDNSNEFVANYINDISSGNSGLKIFEIASNGMVANYADKIIVHSEYVKKLLLEKNISHHVGKIPHYANVTDLNNDINEIRAKLNIADSHIVLSAFGHIHETKRIMPILKAFKKLLELKEDLLLCLVGKPSPDIKQELEQYIMSNKLEDKVIVTGYVDLTTFEDYIDATDICLNLRYPYNGETSGSFMRILAKGKCAVINDVGSFSEVPDDCCVKLSSPENTHETREIDMVYHSLKELISDKELVDNIGINARQYAENELDIKKISKKYADFIKEDTTSSLTDTLIDAIVEETKSSQWNNRNLYQLSATLAYAKSGM
ncbi:glycosyltransferase [Paenibacillus sp. 481]|uniref:glycosyltransferase n=1 Tax=Paenibacillus sp. 481 TaxID=2835869 RepID=UPI001E2B362E|nr:glycosyltransferase [Paenibacillus sp. 481]UHA71656.1 glycosyltransferase [Paenibacillus sp. 481]